LSKSSDVKINFVQLSEQLKSQNSKQQSVKHLAVIMDGNRRWAKQRSLATIEGHGAGVAALKRLVALCPNYSIKYLTVYAFSTENWRRDNNELDFLFKLLASAAVTELNDLIKENVKVSFCGDIDKFKTVGIFDNLARLQEATKLNTGLNLQIALNYGSLAEFTKALNSMQEAKADFSNITQFLDTTGIPEPELLIRTGGRARLSNFLLWQLRNARLVFLDSYWPDFDQSALESALYCEVF